MFSLIYFFIRHATFINTNCLLVVAFSWAADSQSVILPFLTSLLRMHSFNQIYSHVKYTVNLSDLYQLMFIQIPVQIKSRITYRTQSSGCSSRQKRDVFE